MSEGRRIGIEEVRRIALLARLDLTEADLERFTKQLGDVLEHVAALQSLDLRDVPPTLHAIPTQLPERRDVLVPSLAREEALALAPESEDGAYRVPRIVEG